MARVIFHIDLNAFFANAEVLRNSALENQPIAVGGTSRRGVVCTASYAAREKGVKSAMPIHQALLLCPDLILLPGDFAWYEACSKRFFDFIKTFTPYVEPASIDECYCDVTDIIKNYHRPLDLAWIIQKRLYDEIGLPCSIGVAPNRFLAKMASDMRKPMGITVLRIQEIQKKLWPLPIREMQGIGNKTIPLLLENGITTIGDLANPNNEGKIMQLLGKQGYMRIMNARGLDNNQLNFSSSTQSISQSTTLDKDLYEYDEVKTVFKSLAISLSKRCVSDNVKGKLLSISVRYNDFTAIVRSCQLSDYLNDANIILENAFLLFDKNNDSTKPIRHLGISLGSFYTQGKSIDQINLFNQNIAVDTDKVLNELNKQISGHQLVYASTLIKKEH